MSLIEVHTKLVQFVVSERFYKSTYDRRSLGLNDNYYLFLLQLLIVNEEISVLLTVSCVVKQYGESLFAKIGYSTSSNSVVRYTGEW